MKKIIFYLLLTISSSYSCFSQCYDYDAKRIASRCAYLIVEQAWQGGNEISTTVNNCYYNDGNGKWSFDVMIEFYGQLSGNYYRTDGSLKYNIYTNEFNYYPSFKNQKLQDYEAFIGLIVTGAVIYKLSQE